MNRNNPAQQVPLKSPFRWTPARRWPTALAALSLLAIAPQSRGQNAWADNQFYNKNALVTFGGFTWKANRDVAKQHAPQGLGDGSAGDRTLLLNQLTRGWAGSLVTGGNLGVTYHVNTNANSGGTDATHGSLRAALTSPDPLWVVFDSDLDIQLSSTIEMYPNKTIDGRGHTVRIKGCNLQYFGADHANAAANIILAYLTATDINVSPSGSSFFKAGGNGNAGSSKQYGNADLVYFHHLTFLSIRDSASLGAGYVGTAFQCRSTMDWCNFGPNPDQTLINLAGGFLSISANASTNVITTATAHGYSGGQIVQIFKRTGFTLPGGITDGDQVFIRNQTTNTFQVSNTKTGAVIDITSAGTGGWVCDFDGTDPYRSGKGPQWGVNHAAGTVANPSGDPATGDSVYNTTADALNHTNSVGHIKASLTLSNFDNMIIRCPKFNGAYGHVWNCRWYHWGEPTGVPRAAGYGGDFDNQSEVFIHHNIFRPYVNGDAHNWGNYLSPAQTWTASNPTNWAIRNQSGAGGLIQTRISGAVTNWYHGTGTNLGDGDSTANEVAVESGFTRNDPTWIPVPYTYNLQTDEVALEKMVTRGAGNIQPWTKQ